MSIIDNEVVGEVNEKTLPPCLPINELFEDVIQKNIKRYGDSLWMNDASTGRSVKYSEVAPAMKSIASGLRKRGFQPNDVVLIMASNHIELSLTFFGTWKAGGSSACLTLNLQPSEIQKRAETLKPSFVVTDEQRACRVLEAVQYMDCVKEVFIIGNAEGCTSFDQLLQDDGLACPDTIWDLDAAAWIMFSSGTTGEPKAIVHNHRSLNRIVGNYPQNLYTGKKFLFVNLLVNAGGMMFSLLMSYQHCQIHTISDFNFSTSTSDDNLLVAVDKIKPHIVSAFPPQVAFICQHQNLEQYDLTSVVDIFCGGSTLSPFFERQLFDKLPNLLNLRNHYGMSEVGVVSFQWNQPADGRTSITKAQAVEKHVIGSSGKLIPNCRLKVIDESTGKKLGPNEIGHICVITPAVLKEYLNNPKATAEFIQNGWCHTGDKGYYDTEGRIFVIGRYKELIKYRLAHVVPTNIEKFLMKHEAVEDAGVIGLPDDVDGELPMAFVVLKPGYSTTAQEIIEYIDGLVIDEEKLRGGVRYIDRIPRSELGKIIRPKLAELLQVNQTN